MKRTHQTDADHIDPKLQRLLDGRCGITFRARLAAIAALAGVAIMTQIGFELARVAPFISSWVCPAGYRITEASTRELYPDGGPASIHPRKWLGCRGADGISLADDRPHYRIMKTIAVLSFLLLFPFSWRLACFLLPASARVRQSPD
jgi:hypothetical protein